jgi:hypothetical protein
MRALHIPAIQPDRRPQLQRQQPVGAVLGDQRPELGLQLVPVGLPDAEPDRFEPRQIGVGPAELGLARHLAVERRRPLRVAGFGGGRRQTHPGEDRRPPLDLVQQRLLVLDRGEIARQERAAGLARLLDLAVLHPVVTGRPRDGDHHRADGIGAVLLPEPEHPVLAHLVGDFLDKGVCLAHRCPPCSVARRGLTGRCAKARRYRPISSCRYAPRPETPGL